MVANIAGKICGCQNTYNNQIAMNDLSNMNMYYPTGMKSDPLLAMSMNNNSIFGSEMPSGIASSMNADLATGMAAGSTPGMSAGVGAGITPGVGAGMMPGVGAGMMPGIADGMMYGTMPGMMPGMGYMPPVGANSGGANGATTDPYEDYFRQYERYQDFMIDNQVRMQQKQRSADLRLSAPTEGVREHAEYLKDKIIRNEQGQIKGAYDAYIESVKALYGDNADREQIISRANRHYMEANGGKSLVEDIRKYGRDSFTQGALQSVTFGLFNKKTAEETVSELTGQPVGKEENAKKVAGNIVGGAAVGATTFALSGAVMKGLKIASKSKTFWGVLAGGLAGAIAAFAGSR